MRCTAESHWSRAGELLRSEVLRLTTHFLYTLTSHEVSYAVFESTALACTQFNSARDRHRLGGRAQVIT